MENCKHIMNKVCDPKTCICDEDITDVILFSRLEQAVTNTITVSYNEKYDYYSNALRLGVLTPKGRVKTLQLSSSDIEDDLKLKVEFY